jgi:hypothetical protein
MLFGIALALSAQQDTFMLPSPVRLTGVVTDNAGQPLKGVWIDHTGARVENIVTDSNGRFDIETRAPAVVFRQNGFKSRYWRVADTGPVKIVLDGPAPLFRECNASSRCLSLGGFHSTFCLPRIKGVKVSNQGNDVDYGQRFFWTATAAGRVGIQHASGPMWGDGLPFNEQVWSAKDYTETTYRDRDGFWIIDVRVTSSYGLHWRLLGHAFETAEYRALPDGSTTLLDKVLDGACITPTRFEHTH